MEGSVITIVLVIAHSLLRYHLKECLEATAGLLIVGAAADGVSGLAMAVKFKPGVVITDLLLSDMSGLEVIRQVHRVMPDTPTILFSIHDPDIYKEQALKDGASRYVSKQAPFSDLLEAIHQVA